MSAKVLLAEALAESGDTERAAALLVDLCRPPASARQTAHADARVRAGVDAALRFLTVAPPSDAAESLLGVVFASLPALAAGGCDDVGEAEAEAFARAAVGGIATVARRSQKWRALAAAELLGFLRRLLDAEGAAAAASLPPALPRMHVARGALSALCCCDAAGVLAQTADDAQAFAGLLEDAVLRWPAHPLAEHALLALAHCVGASAADGCPPQLCKRLYATATAPAMQEEAFVPAVRLAMACAECDDGLAGALAELLSGALEALEEDVEGTDEDEQLAADIAETSVFVCRTLTALQARRMPPLAIDDTLRFVLDSELTLKLREVRDVGCSCLCQLLKVECASKGEDSVRPVVSKLLSRISRIHESRHRSQSPSQQQQQQQHTPGGATLGNEISSLKAICTELGSQKVVDQVVSGMINLVAYPLCAVDKAIITALIQIAATSTVHTAASTDVVMLVINVYKRLVKDAIQNGTPLDGFIEELSNNLVDFARTLKDPGLKQQLCNRFLVLFQQLGQDTKIQRGVRPEEIPTVMAMQSMLAFVAEFIQGIDEDTVLSPDEATQQLFRSVWLYCVFLGFASGGHMSDDWKTPIARFAHKVPVLSLGKSHQLIKIQMEVEAIIRFSFDPSSDMGQVTKRLFRHLRACSAQIRHLTVPQCSFLLAVYYLEVLRVRSGEHRALFSYLKDVALADTRVPNVGYLLTVFRATADEVFLELINGLNLNKFAENSRSEKLATICEFLLAHYCSDVDAVRNAADVYISQFVGNFPQVLWHPKCIHMLLELLDVVSKSRSVGPLDQLCKEIPGTTHFINLPETAQGTQRLLSSVVSLCNIWLREAVKRAPAETLSALQRYIGCFSESSGRLAAGHFGVALAAEILSSPTAVEGPSAAERRTTGTGSSFVTGLSSKSRFAGEVNGMVALLETLEGTGGAQESEASAVQRVADMVLGRLDEIGRMQPRAEPRTYLGAMYQACAFLARHPDHSCAHELVSRTVWVPVRVFTRESLEVATTAWSWLLSTPHAAIADTLIAQIWLAWTWTINARLGLFSDTPRNPSPLSVSGEGAVSRGQATTEAKQADWKDDCTPHRVWLSFLEERLVVSENTENARVDVLLRILYRSCANPEMLSVLPGSFGVRFQMLKLAMKLARVLRERRLHSDAQRKQLQQHTTQLADDPHDEIAEFSLVDRVHSAALAWFVQPPSWYEPADRDTLSADISAVVEFCEALAPAGSSSLVSDRSSSKRGGGTTRSGDKASVRSASSVSLVPAMLSATQVAEESAAQPLGGDDAETRRKALLLVLLLGNELERITAWNNPLNRISAQPGLLNGDHAQLRALRLSWQEYVDAAWEHSPDLAVMLWLRHPAAPEELRKAVTHHVLHEPALVASCPQAIRLLVTEDHVQRDIPQLKHLLYWTPTDPPTALWMLRKQFQGHPLVTQYALRVLRQFTPDTLAFYLPQLVQCLRYDRSGLVEEYLVEACGRSELLAHQLIWNAQTYPKQQADIATAPGTPTAGAEVEAAAAAFAEKVDRVKTRVLGDFSAEQRERFEDEFAFFEQFTQISARLHAVDEPMRKARLREELKKAAPKRGTASYAASTIYLPFSPHVAVRGIDTDSGAVLRSAEKVPILVQFHVNDRSAAPDAPTRLHSVIFKSGDDTRQDMLAVQVIELLMRMFDHAGLALYLFPYKIIATRPDCGMIEVVPNTMSRDQLGQKTDGTMFDYFLSRYGARNTPGFQQARSNFVRSMAAYSVASYILQVKDRHNGNILIDDSGHLVHIDFGFLFDRSPGGDIGFERAPFKITQEMIDIMGGTPTADQFVWFLEQGVRAFLSAREYAPAMATIVELMLDTQLPCFKPASVDNLMARFFPDLTPSTAAKSMSNLMAYAFSSSGTFFTYFYDKFQQFDNGIAM